MYNRGQMAFGSGMFTNVTTANSCAWGRDDTSCFHHIYRARNDEKPAIWDCRIQHVMRRDKVGFIGNFVLIAIGHGVIYRIIEKMSAQFL